MAVELSDVHCYYPDRPTQPILKIPSWTLETSEKVFIHGPSGGGKSTLLNILCGLLPPTHGRVRVLGQSLERMSARQLDQFRAENIGYVLQQFNLIPYLDAVDNILLANQFSKKQKSTARPKDAEQLLSRLNIAQSDWHLPSRNLSIGQQQRVAIARALINKPQLLIVDEPTSSLDSANREAFMTLLMEQTKAHNMTLLFVSHDMSLAHYFDRVETLSSINNIEGDD